MTMSTRALLVGLLLVGLLVILAARCWLVNPLINEVRQTKAELNLLRR